VTPTRVIRGVGRGPMPLPGSALGVKSCRQRMNALKIAGDSLREEGVKMSWNVPDQTRAWQHAVVRLWLGSADAVAVSPTPH
jgi:hypothetical protein